MKISINDYIIEGAEAHLGVYDLGLNRGYAVFDYFKIVDNNFRFFDDHLDRFLLSIRLSNIPCQYSREQIKAKVINLKELNNIENGYVRITLSAGDSDDFASIVTSRSNLIIIVGCSSAIENNNTKEGVKLISKYYQRSIPNIKTTDYFFAQMHRQEMLNANAVDILYYTSSITETSRANIFFVKDDSLYTPKSNILEGITRQKVLSLYGNSVIGNIKITQINEFEESFICSSTREITPVIMIDDIKIGSGEIGPVVSGVVEAFRAISS